MLLVEEQKSLIEKFVRANKNFSGNEDLFEDFCSESFEKSYMMFNSTSNIQKIESYVSKVVSTSILNVLKNSGRIKRTSTGYESTKEVVVPDVEVTPSAPEPVLDTTPPAEENSRYFIYDFPDPKETAEEVMITRECIKKITDAVCIIHKEVPAQMFLDIFCLRYIEGKKQSEIAETLKISQSAVSKRLMQLSKLISNLVDSKKS